MMRLGDKGELIACPFCSGPARSQGLGSYVAIIDVSCDICGRFGYPTLDNDFAKKVPHEWLASAILRSRTIRQGLLPPLIVPRGDINRFGVVPGWAVVSTEEFLGIDPPSISDRLDRSLENLAIMQRSIGHGVQLDPEKDAPILWVESRHEMTWMLKSLHELGLVVYHESSTWAQGQKLGKAQLTAKGWQRVEQLHGGGGIQESKTVFVAMWFDKSMDHVFDTAIDRAIRDAGYEPTRVDRTEHLNLIDDQIVALIKRSRFVIADFTGARGGVYYEAGLAHGLGKQVVFAVEDCHVKDLHFDTNHFPHIVWTRQNLEKLRADVFNRILAVIGPGPHFKARQ